MFPLRSHPHDKHARLCLMPHIPPQAFTVVAVFNSMTFALKVTPLAVRSLSEGAVAIRRFQVRTERTSACNLCPNTRLVNMFEQLEFILRMLDK